MTAERAPEFRGLNELSQPVRLESFGSGPWLLVFLRHLA